MVMSLCDSIFSVEENFEDTEQAFHPSLLLQATSIPTNSRKRKSIDSSIVTIESPQRRRAWRERDSILLVQAYAWVEKTKKGTTFFNYHMLIKEW